jgi:mRNA deadenylase 3'-5' endonuclease subunit Ccr4
MASLVRNDTNKNNEQIIPKLFKPNNKAIKNHKNGDDNNINNTFSILSYNILLPNSIDGWWTFKNYCPITTSNKNNDASRATTTTSWQARKILLKNKIFSENPQIICMQEASDVSYLTDFDFLINDNKWGFVIHDKGKNRMHPITFYRNDCFKIINGKSFLKDQTIITPFQTVSSDNESKIFWVINCHLKSGTYAADRRLRQIHEAMETIRKKSQTLFCNKGEKKNKKNEMQNPSTTTLLPPRVIIAGDFNSTSNINVGTGRYLLYGIVEKGFKEYGKSITSKDKVNYCGVFHDAYALAYKQNQQQHSSSSPPTLIAPSLIPRMEKVIVVNNVTETETGTTTMEYHPTNALIQAIELIHAIYADITVLNEKQMSKKGVEQWLYDINKSIERGDEMRHAFKILNEKKKGTEIEDLPSNTNNDNTSAKTQLYITSNDLLSIYTTALRGGKYWSIAADIYIIAEKYDKIKQIAALNVLPPFYIEARDPTNEEASKDLYLGVLDYIFFTPKGFKCNGVLDISTYKLRPIPDAIECSDHFALKASFTFL